MYLKDVVAKHLIEEGPDFGDKEEETNEHKNGISKIVKGENAFSLNQEEVHFVNKDRKKTYDDEQEELKRAFREAEEKEEGMGDDEGDFLTLKKAGEDKVDSDDKELEEKLNDYFSFSGDHESFLRNYFMNKTWKDKNAEKSNVGGEDLQEISEDEMEIERQEEYEHQLQENSGDRVYGGGISEEKEKYTERAEKERMAITQKEKDEEIKHLKNVKKHEIQERIKKIMKTAGINDVDNEEEKSPEKGSRKRKHKTSLLEKATMEMMDEYYGIDYGDTIEDIKTRFKYAQTKPNKFSMSAPEILLMDDKELNQHVPLKKNLLLTKRRNGSSANKKNLLLTMRRNGSSAIKIKENQEKGKHG